MSSNRMRWICAALFVASFLASLANRAVAEILIASEKPSIYRIHAEPDEEQWATIHGAMMRSSGVTASEISGAGE